MGGLNIIDKLYNQNLLKDDEEVLLSDGFDQAIIGVTANSPKKIIYDYYKAIDIIMKSDKTIEIDECMEWLDEHMSCNLGEQTPIFIKKL